MWIWLLIHAIDSVLVRHDDIIKWKHFPRNWPFVGGIHRSRWIPRTKGQLRGALMFSLICVWINGQVNNSEVGDLRLHRGHYDVIVIKKRLHMSWAILNNVCSRNLSFEPGDSIWHWRFWSTLVRVMGLTCSAPTHHLNQCSLKSIGPVQKNKNQWNQNQDITIGIAKNHLKMLSVKCQPFCLGLNMLINTPNKYCSVWALYIL